MLAHPNIFVNTSLLFQSVSGFFSIQKTCLNADEFLPVGDDLLSNVVWSFFQVFSGTVPIARIKRGERDCSVCYIKVQITVDLTHRLSLCVSFQPNFLFCKDRPRQSLFMARIWSLLTFLRVVLSFSNCHMSCHQQLFLWPHLMFQLSNHCHFLSLDIHPLKHEVCQMEFWMRLFIYSLLEHS